MSWCLSYFVCMKTNQEYVISNLESFELSHIFDCRQCFRRNKEIDWSYIWVFRNNVLNVQKSGTDIIFKWVLAWDIKQIINDYFDLNKDYEIIKNKLSKVDKYMKESIDYWYWIRLLNQDFRETIISFII